MKLASGAATSMNNRMKPACKIPANWLGAPARTLVAVRAIVPVTLIAPNTARARIGYALGNQLHVRAALATGQRHRQLLPTTGYSIPSGASVSDSVTRLTCWMRWGVIGGRQRCREDCGIYTAKPTTDGIDREAEKQRPKWRRSQPQSACRDAVQLAGLMTTWSFTDPTPTAGVSLIDSACAGSRAIGLGNKGPISRL